MSKFNLEKHVTDSLHERTLENAIEFATAHGFELRAVKQWDREIGNWRPFIITRDYKEKRINVALNENGTVHSVHGMG